MYDSLRFALARVGDGITDAQARPPADAFIGYGGNIVRENTKAMADLYIDDFKVSVRLLLFVSFGRFCLTR